MQAWSMTDAAHKTTVRWRLMVGALLAAIVGAVGLCEVLGWPFLAAPAQRWNGRALARTVDFSDASAPGATRTTPTRR